MDEEGDTEMVITLRMRGYCAYDVGTTLMRRLVDIRGTRFAFDGLVPHAAAYFIGARSSRVRTTTTFASTMSGSCYSDLEDAGVRLPALHGVKPGVPTGITQEVTPRRGVALVCLSVWQMLVAIRFVRRVWSYNPSPLPRSRSPTPSSNRSHSHTPCALHTHRRMRFGYDPDESTNMALHSQTRSLAPNARTPSGGPDDKRFCRLFIADTSASFEALKLDFLPESEKAAVGKAPNPMGAHTASGDFRFDLITAARTYALNARSQPLVAAGSPSLLSAGYWCEHKGYSFWSLLFQ